MRRREKDELMSCEGEMVWLRERNDVFQRSREMVKSESYGF